MKIIPYIATILLGISIVNIWFFLTTYKTLKSEYYKTPKEVIIKEYVSKECECAECPICESWVDIPAIAE